MIKVEDLSYGFPEKDLYKKISFTIEDGDHAALIGSNGTGKTTLVDLLMHADTALYDGRIRMDNAGRIGYVSQFVRHEKDRSQNVYDYLAEDFLHMQKEMEEICLQMETAEDVEPLYEKYQEKVDIFDAADGYNYDTNIHHELKTAGLTRLEELPVSALSGGEFKLIQIIRQMLLRPGLLIMDEPDVFLDFENLDGLCSLINAYKGTMLVVTHSRFLLNHCFNRILHLENMDIQEFEGNYTDYNLALLQMKVELQEQAHKDDEWIAVQEALVERLRDTATKVSSSSRGKTLKARVSYLARLEARRIKAPFVEIRKPEICLPDVYSEPEPELQADDGEEIYKTVQIPETVLTVSDYRAAFDEVLLDHVNFELGPHDKAAVVGPNGTGKTTLVRDIISGKCPQIRIAPETEVAFLSQIYGDQFDEEATVFENFEKLGFETKREVTSYLEKYCFEPESADKKVGILSGGEKNLLGLAKIALTGAQLLILDEPTSHLDLYAQVALEQALNDYKGAVLMVSHDFYMIADTMDHVLLVEDGTIRKTSGRAFRKMIYKRHYSREYLELEQDRKQLEMKVQALLKAGDFEKARTVCEQLDTVVSKMRQLK